jgi:ribonuclease E
VVVAESVNLEQTLADSGLVLVQTTSAPAIVPQPEPAVKLGRPRKQKPLAEQADDVPLTMVETGK